MADARLHFSPFLPTIRNISKFGAICVIIHLYEIYVYLFIILFWGLIFEAQGLLLILGIRITPGKLGEPYRIPGVK